MRYFKKNNTPLSLTQWLAVYDEALKSRYADTTKSIDSIWSDLGKALDKTNLSDEEQVVAKQLQDLINKELDESLLREQGFICCYCGKRIPENKVFVREHFKDKKDYRNSVFQYQNLLASCEGGKITSYSIGQTVELLNGDKVVINSIADVVKVLNQKLLGITKEIIENYSKNKGRTFGKGDKIYFPNPPHCDTAKGDKINQIVNPTIHVGCENWFIYEEKENTEIEIKPHYGENKKLVDETIKVLELNAGALKGNRHRLSAFQKGNGKVSEMTELINSIDDYETKEAYIKDYIENEVYAKTEDKLETFCFVTASVVWNSFL